MVNKKLYEIANIQSGLVVNRKEAKSEDAIAHIYKRLNLRSINDFGAIDVEQLDDFNSIEQFEQHTLTHKDDIIIRMFAPICPALITEETEGLVVPSQLAIVRLKNKKKVLPNYLRYFLSQERITNKILLEEGWQTQRNIKISSISNLDIPLPSIEYQNKIVEITKLNVTRKQLYQELALQEDILVEFHINKIIGGIQK